MKKITESNLKFAFTSECNDYVRYLLYAEKAKEEGFQNLTRLFQSIAYAERVHAKKYLLSQGELGNSANNLENALNNEKFQVEEMYPAYFEVAGMQNEVESQISFHCSVEVEQIHATLFQKAKESISGNKDIILGEIHICTNCGFTLEGEPPASCPVCGIPKERFKTF